VSSGTDNWDDVGETGNSNNGLDLADFSAATLKFRSQMDKFEKGDVQLYDSNDVMEGLYREQAEQESIRRGGLDEELEEQMPEWADEGDSMLGPSNVTIKDSLTQYQTTNAPGRALLNAIAPSSTNAPITVDKPKVDMVDDLFASDIRGKSAANAGYHSNLVMQNSSTDFVYQNSATAEVILRSQVTAHQASIRSHVPSLEDALWLYLDPRGRTQGQFSTTSMRQWMVDGYFSPSLPIKLSHWSTFYPLHAVFADAPSAFQNIPLEPLPPVSSPLLNPIAAMQINIPIEPLPIAQHSKDQYQSSTGASQRAVQTSQVPSIWDVPPSPLYTGVHQNVSHVAEKQDVVPVPSSKPLNTVTNTVPLKTEKSTHTSSSLNAEVEDINKKKAEKPKQAAPVEKVELKVLEETEQIKGSTKRADDIDPSKINTKKESKVSLYVLFS
jgi:hypothetical protein